MKCKRVHITRHGGSQVLSLVEDEIPEPKNYEVRVKILATGVSLADVLMREGMHPESWLRRLPFSPGWDLVGVVDKLGDKLVSLSKNADATTATTKMTTPLQLGQMVAALPIVGGYVEYICLPWSELVAVPDGLSPADAVSIVFNYTVAYQMLHRIAHVKPGERVLIHSAAGGIGTALLQLGKLAGLEMYGTASYHKHKLVSDLGGIPIDYKSVDFVEEVFRLTGNGDDNSRGGVDVVFDGIGGKSLRRSYRTLRNRGRLIAYGFTSMSKDWHSSHRHYRHHDNTFYRILAILKELKYWLSIFSLNLIPDDRKVFLYSIQMLKRRKPSWFRQDLIVLLNLLQQQKIKPVIGALMPLDEASHAHDLLEDGSVIGKIVLICNA